MRGGGSVLMVKAYSLGSEKSYPKRPDIPTWQLQVNGDSSEKNEPFKKWLQYQITAKKITNQRQNTCWLLVLNLSIFQCLGFPAARFAAWNRVVNWNDMKLQLASVSGETKEVEIQDGLIGELTGSLVCLIDPGDDPNFFRTISNYWKAEETGSTGAGVYPHFFLFENLFLHSADRKKQTQPANVGRSKQKWESWLIHVEDYSSHHGSVEIELSLCYSKHSFFFQPTKSEFLWSFFRAGNGEHGSLPKTRKKTPLPFSTQRDFVLRKVSFVQRAFFQFFLKSRVFFLSMDNF